MCANMMLFDICTKVPTGIVALTQTTESNKVRRAVNRAKPLEFMSNNHGHLLDTFFFF